MKIELSCADIDLLRRAIGLAQTKCFADTQAGLTRKEITYEMLGDLHMRLMRAEVASDRQCAVERHAALMRAERLGLVTEREAAQRRATIMLSTPKRFYDELSQAWIIAQARYLAV